MVACEGWLRDRNAKPPLELQRRLLTIVFSDPEPQVASLAARSIDNFSSELGAEIGAGLASVDRPERFRAVLSGVQRRDDPAVLDGLRAVVLQESRPVWQRLAAAEAFEYVALRTRQPPGRDHFEDLYRLVVEALIAGDPELLIQIGRDDRVSNPAAFVLAVANKASLDGVGPDGLAPWFEANPGLAAAMTAYAPEAATPRAAFESLFRDSLRRQTPNTADRLNDVRAYWFPTEPEPAEDGEGPG